MKKILLVVLALILVALPLTACDNNDDNKIIVNETTHSIFTPRNTLQWLSATSRKQAMK